MKFTRIKSTHEAPGNMPGTQQEPAERQPLSRYGTCAPGALRGETWFSEAGVLGRGGGGLCYFPAPVTWEDDWRQMEQDANGSHSTYKLLPVFSGPQLPHQTRGV